MIILFLLSLLHCDFDYKTATVSLSREDRTCTAYDGYLDTNNEKSCATFTANIKPAYDWIEAWRRGTEEDIYLYWYDKTLNITKYLNVEIENYQDFEDEMKYYSYSNAEKDNSAPVCDIYCTKGEDTDECEFDGLIPKCQECEWNQVVNEYNNKCVDADKCTSYFESYEEYLEFTCPSECINGCQDLYYYCRKAREDPTLCDKPLYIEKCQDWGYCESSQQTSLNASTSQLRSIAFNNLIRRQTNAKIDKLYFLHISSTADHAGVTWKDVETKLHDLTLAVVFHGYMKINGTDIEKFSYYIPSADTEFVDAALFSLPTRVAAVCAMLAGLVLTWLL